MKMKIVENVYTNKLLQDAISNIVDPYYQDDFRSHFILQVINMTEEKLINLWNKNQLDWVLLKVITNQWHSNTSTFWKIYRNHGISNKNIHFVDMEYNIEREEQEIIEPKEYKLTELKKTIKQELENQHTDWQTNNYHKTLFILYHFEHLTLKEIESKTGVNMFSVHKSIKKSREYLKTKIQRWD